jgi:malate dehydrogenase
VVGAAGGIGQPLSLILKASPYVSELRVFDVAEIKVPAEGKEPAKSVPTVKGIAADLSHINTGAVVTGFGAADMADALKGVDVVVVPAGVPRKPGMTRDDLFNTNASIVANIAKGVAKSCPNAIVCIISNPVNSTVPIVAEVLKKSGVYKPEKLLGVTSLDLMRAATFYASERGFNPENVLVPVVGGHAGTTIVPLFSQVELSGASGSSNTSMAQDDLEKLTKRVMFGGDEVVAAKAGAGSATLSMALAGANFVNDVLRALGGKSVESYAFVESKVTKAQFFSSKIRLGRKGVEEIYGLGSITPYEEKLVNAMLDDLVGQINKGIKFAADQK